MIGRTLAQYRITAKLGEGGMGTVWRATDTTLGRDVAIKLLPDDFAADPERQARFEREARLLASLNHPNIASIFGLQESGGVRALVMELVEGEGLDERLARGPIPVDEALPMALQIAQALEAAHEHGIVHRDLKPANIRLRPDGTVKVLDFGLAKARAEDTEGSDLSLSPTITARHTSEGVILGTAAYMAPEQAKGKAVDKRADIWAFGVVLLEMLTGRQPFLADTTTETLSAVLTLPVELGALPPATPAAARHVLRRCLERDPKQRLRDIGEARIAIESPASADAAAAESATRRRWPRWALAATAASVLAVAVIAGFVSGRRTSPVAASDLNLARLTFRRGTVLTARFTPDGRSVVYGAAWEGGTPDLYAVRLDSRESRSLGLEGADLLSVSSNGELAVSLGRRYTVGWESTGTLARMPMDGGAPRQVLEGVQDADWSPDGTTFAVVRNVGSKRRLEYPIGHVLYETGGWISHPRVSHDGRLVAFLDHPNRGDNQASVEVVDAQRKLHQVASVASNGLAWSADGDELLYAAGPALWRSTLGGDARLIFRTVGGVFLHDVSRQGNVLLSRTNMQREIVGLAPGAARERSLSWLDWSFPTALSKDGRTLLFEEQNLVTAGDYALFLRPTGGAPPIRLGDGRGYAISHDGAWVLTTRNVDGATELVMLPTGPGDARRLGVESIVPTAGTFLPGDDGVVLAGHSRHEGARLYRLDLGSGTLQPISPQGITDYFCDMVSPDGSTAFATGPDGMLTLYPVQGGAPRRVPGTTLDDIGIRWSADGRAVYVQHGSALPARVERIDAVTGERSPWKELTPPDPAGVEGIGPVQISADGRAYVYSYRRKLDELYVVRGFQ